MNEQAEIEELRNCIERSVHLLRSSLDVLDGSVDSLCDFKTCWKSLNIAGHYLQNAENICYFKSID